MNLNYLIAPLLLLPLCAYSQENSSATHLQFRDLESKKNTLVKSYTNEAEREQSINEPERTIDFPTQVIRTSGNVEHLKISCEQVNNEIEKAFISHITKDKFTYNTIVYCKYNPDSMLAIQYTINSYFDPINDEGVSYLNTFLAEYNGSDLMGTKLEIESSKGLVVALSIAVGIRKNPQKPPFIQYRQDRANFYFKNNYEMRNSLFNDIATNFASNDPDKVLPFLDKWLFPYAGSIYRAVLRDSNFAELYPERVFLMEQGDSIFISNLKFYFAHNCMEHETHKCL